MGATGAMVLMEMKGRMAWRGLMELMELTELMGLRELISSMNLGTWALMLTELTISMKPVELRGQMALMELTAWKGSMELRVLMGLTELTGTRLQRGWRAERPLTRPCSVEKSVEA